MCGQVEGCVMDGWREGGWMINGQVDKRVSRKVDGWLDEWVGDEWGGSMDRWVGG